MTPICRYCLTTMGLGKAIVPVYDHRRKGRGSTLAASICVGTILVAVHKCKTCGYTIDPCGHTFEKE